MASENILILLSVVFKKFRFIANEFLSVICQFLYVGIMNLSLESIQGTFAFEFQFTGFQRWLMSRKMKLNRNVKKYNWQPPKKN